jgi:hypothetical protein
VTFLTPRFYIKKAPLYEQGKLNLVTELKNSPLQSILVNAGLAGKSISKFTLSVTDHIRLKT